VRFTPALEPRWYSWYGSGRHLHRAHSAGREDPDGPNRTEWAGGGDPPARRGVDSSERALRL